MRLICIESTEFITGSSAGQTAVHKGSIYHVVDVLQGGPNSEMHGLIKDLPDSMFPAHGDWYELLEAAGYHHSSKFLEIPNDLEEEHSDGIKTKVCGQ